MIVEIRSRAEDRIVSIPTLRAVLIARLLPGEDTTGAISDCYQIGFSINAA